MMRIDPLTGVKSPDDQILAIRPTSSKNTDESFISSKAHETTHVETGSLESTKQNILSSKKHDILNTHSSKLYTVTLS
jgi:hypothetical protein